ncbi:hypothetical protein SMICM304S_02362 [Streptomyces microflavus]
MNLGLVTESFSQDKRDWLQGAHGTDIVPSVTLDVSKFTAGTHYPDGYVKSGIPLGRITTGQKVGPYATPPPTVVRPASASCTRAWRS